MRARWPPSPSVEDEEASLAHEHLIDTSVQQLKSDDHPVENRGTVNQHPIILDVKDGQPTAENQAAGTQSSDESCGPRTPPPVRTERNHGIPTSRPARASSPQPDEKGSHSESTSRTDRAQTPRGRPRVTRLQTDVGGDLEGMITGHRRAPSPYAFTPTQNMKPEPARRFSGEQLLSPQSAAFPSSFNSKNTHEEGSSRRRVEQSGTESSTDSEHYRHRRRHHSRRRSTTASVEQSKPRWDDLPQRFTHHQPPRLHDGVERGSLARSATQPAHSHVVDSYSIPNVVYMKESPYNSSSEDNRTRRSNRPEGDGRSIKASPRTSDEDERVRSSRRHDKGRSRRSSTYADQKPRLEAIGHHYSCSRGESVHGNYGSSHQDGTHYPGPDRKYPEPTTPTSNHSAQTMEEVIERAFRANKAKRSSYGVSASANPSPYVSPPQTPPRTPRVERLSQEYFGTSSPAPHYTVRPSRTSSIDQTQPRDYRAPNDARSVTSVLPSAPTSVPSLSRSSTTSHEMTSSISSSGQRSRRPSPVYEDLRPVSRSGSVTSQGDFALPRQSTVSFNDEKPTSRSGLNIQIPHEQPRHLQRASSYNAAIDHSVSRPSPSHRMSSTLLPAIPLAEQMRQIPESKVPQSPSVFTEQSPILPTEPAPVLPPPCPRSVPRSGFSDWYTIKGIPEIDICPSCMGTLGNTKFRDHFIPAMPKARGQEVKCSMSNPWMRVAWAQIIKQNRSTLEMLWNLVHRPPTTRPCPGRRLETRPWYRMIDPAVGRPVPHFEVCSACVYAVDIIFPNLTGLLERTDSLVEECKCHLNIESRRFSRYIYELEKAHFRCKGRRFRNSDVQPLVDFTRKTARFRECDRDVPLLTSAWHFMPELPDFTICEECYEEVVRPLVDKPIARDVSRTLRLVPTARPGQFRHGRTCQLYSDRMRRLFRDAVKHDDLEILHMPALKRLDAEQLLQEKHHLLMSDVKAGYDRTAELEKNTRIWKTWE